MTTVVHCRKENFDVYIGRSDAEHHYGNPASHIPSKFVVVKVATRAEAILFYRDWLEGKYPEIEPLRRSWILANLNQLKDKRLGCFCSPLPCHGDVLAEIAEKECNTL